MISAIVLAAGQATRFGQCKQLMPLGGRTLLEHVLANLRASKIDDVVVVLGARAEEIRSRVSFDRERVVMNERYADGMSTSIQAGLRALPGDAEAAMIVLADQPFVLPSTYDALIDAYRAAPADVVLPTYNGFRGNPVIVDRALFVEMMAIRGDTGCRAIFGEHAPRKVAVDDRGVVTDIDTPEDFTYSSFFPRGGEKVPQADEGRPSPGASRHPLLRAGEGSQKPDLLETIVDLRRRRQPFATATVVRAERPTSSKPGDKAIIAPDGTLTGWIGGSCAHDIVVRNALEALEEGAPRFLTLSSASPAAQRQGVIDVPMQCYSGGVLDVFIEPNLPRPRMVIVGHESIACALAAISRTLRFHVTVVDPLATREGIPEADDILSDLSLPVGGEQCVVIATHGRYDEEALEQALRTEASYIALVSSPKRAQTMLQILRDRGVAESDLARVKAPAGLDIGAQGAEEIALSIVAEIVRDRRAAAAKPAVQVPQPTTATDPICQMTVTIADARYVAEHEGRRYYFCCQHCQRTFEKEPQRYVHVA